MNTVMTYRTNSSSSEKTEQLAALLGARLRGGEVIALNSDLGGGKTAFVRGLARGIGSTDHVSSPTFTISRQYRGRSVTPSIVNIQANSEADNETENDAKLSNQSPASIESLTLYHFDFYRLTQPGLMSLELTETLDDPAAVVAIEWGGIVEGVLPDDRLSIQITRTGDNARDFVFEYPESLTYLIPEDYEC